MGRDYSTVVFRDAVTKNYIHPPPHAYYTEVEFRFPFVFSWCNKNIPRWLRGFEIGMRLAVGCSGNYLLGVPMTKIIPGLRFARFPLFSFRSSTVTL